MVLPSKLTVRQCRYQAPLVLVTAIGATTSSWSRFNGSHPSRVRACEIPDLPVSGGGGRSHFGGPGGATPRMLDGGEWRQCGLVTRIPPFGRGFSRHRGLPIRWVFLESAEARASALRSSSR